MQAPAYHMRIKDLVLAQKVEYLWVARTDPEKILELYHKHQHDLAALRQQHRDKRAPTHPSQGEELAHEVEALVKAHPSLLE